MNEQPKSKQYHGDSITCGSNRPRNTVRGKRNAARRRSGAINPPAAAEVLIHPARGLLICMGWLRLFRAIVSEDIRSVSRPFSHEI